MGKCMAAGIVGNPCRFTSEEAQKHLDWVRSGLHEFVLPNPTFKFL